MKGRNQKQSNGVSSKQGKISLLKVAKRLLKAGFSIVPVDKETKAPLIPGWKKYQEKPPMLREVKGWFTSIDQDTCIAVIGGKVSQNIEILDFDVEGELYDTWKKKVKKSKPKLLKKLIIETTQSNGFHVIFSCPKVAIPSSDKLAYLKIKVNGPGQHLYEGKKYTAKKINGEYFILPIAIETRGDRSYCIIAPSPGYTFIQNNFTKLPKITPKERDFLIKSAQLLNEYIAPSNIKHSSQGNKKDGASKKSWEDFNERGDIHPILKKHQWKKTKSHSSKYQYYRRPGKNKGVSASLIDDKFLHCFSTNAAPFEEGVTYSPYAVYALLEHGGDFKKASKKLSVQGYGASQASSIEIDKKTLKKRSKNILKPNDSLDEFDPSRLPSRLVNYIAQKSKETEAARIIIIESFLCSLSAVIGKRMYIPEGKYFQQLFPNLWCLSISVSGEFKTTALNKGAELAIRLRNKLQDKIDTKKSYLEEEQDQDKKTVVENQIKELERYIPILPQKSTGEGMLSLLSERNGGMIICSEFGEWAENLGRTYNQGYKALLTDLYDVPQIVENVTKGEGLVAIRQPFITINAVSTLTWVENNINKADVSSGFFARFLIFNPPKNVHIPPALPKKTKLDHTLIQRIEASIKPIKLIEFKLTKGAEKKFKKIHDRMYQKFEKQPEKTKTLLGPYLKRWSPYILKIAMLLQVIDDPNTDKIKKKAIIGAKSIVDYAIKSTVTLFKNELGESEQQRKRRKILEYIAKRKGKVTRGQIIRSKVLDGSVKEYDGVLKTLLSEGSLDLDKTADREYDWIYVLL